MSQMSLGLGREAIGDIERALFERGEVQVVGVDEVGRGPLAGPVTAAAVLISLKDLAWCGELDDSKKLTAKQRGALVPLIHARAIAWEVEHAWPDEVDRVNVLWASMAAMERAVTRMAARVAIADTTVLVDGNRTIPGIPNPQRAIVKGDGRCYAIAAASVLAKEVRDALMVEYEAVYPGYGFAQHKGYPTKQHMRALQTLGVSAIHRRTFAPVAALLRAVE